MPGVDLYLSEYKRSITAKLKKGDFFNEPSQVSLDCVATGSVVIPDGAFGGREGEDIFEERKNLNLFENKFIKIRRIVDRARSVLIYVVYATRLGSGEDAIVSPGRYNTEICTLPIAFADSK